MPLILRGKSTSKDNLHAVIKASSAKEARFFLKFLKESLKLNTGLKIKNYKKKKEYYISFFLNKGFIKHLRKFSAINKGINPVSLKCCRKSLLKAFFVFSGTVNSPKKFYNLEWRLKSKGLLKIISAILMQFGINFKKRKKGQKFIVYVKRAEDIIKVLNLIGAYRSQLYFEEIRAIKETKDEIQRRVNCEIANLEKVTRASSRQVFNIRCIKQRNKMSFLSEGLRRVIEARLKYPEASLSELGRLMSPPISKSSVARRLNVVEEMAEKFKKQRAINV